MFLRFEVEAVLFVMVVISEKRSVGMVSEKGCLLGLRMSLTPSLGMLFILP